MIQRRRGRLSRAMVHNSVCLFVLLTAPSAARAQAPPQSNPCPRPPPDAPAPRDISTLALAGEWRLVVKAAQKWGLRSAAGVLTLLRSDSVRARREAHELMMSDSAYWVWRPFIGWVDIDTTVGVGGSRSIASRDLAAPGASIRRGTRAILLGLVPGMTDGYGTQLVIDHVRPDTLWGSWEQWHGIEYVEDPARGRFCASRRPLP